MTHDELIKQLLQQNESLSATVDSLNATVNAQTQLIAQFNQTIQELREQLNKNFKNSSKPPSSDGFKKPAPKSLRKPSGKKAGGQNGHQGTNLAVITALNEIVRHMPSACEGCQYYQICKGTACVAEKRHVIDAVVTVNVTEHRALELPICIYHILILTSHILNAYMSKTLDILELYDIIKMSNSFDVFIIYLK